MQRQIVIMETTKQLEGQQLQPLPLNSIATPPFFESGLVVVLCLFLVRYFLEANKYERQKDKDLINKLVDELSNED